MVGLLWFVVDALAERLAAGAPKDPVFAGPQGGALRVTLFQRRLLAANPQGGPGAGRPCFGHQRGPGGG
jgi:hypothetical protein